MARNDFCRKGTVNVKNRNPLYCVLGNETGWGEVDHGYVCKITGERSTDAGRWVGGRRLCLISSDCFRMAERMPRGRLGREYDVVGFRWVPWAVMN